MNARLSVHQRRTNSYEIPTPLVTSFYMRAICTAWNLLRSRFVFFYFALFQYLLCFFFAFCFSLSRLEFLLSFVRTLIPHRSEWIAYLHQANGDRFCLLYDYALQIKDINRHCSHALATLNFAGCIWIQVIVLEQRLTTGLRPSNASPACRTGLHVESLENFYEKQFWRVSLFSLFFLSFSFNIL